MPASRISDLSQMKTDIGPFFQNIDHKQLILGQILMDDLLSATSYTTEPDTWRYAVLRIWQATSDLESIMWMRLHNDEDYLTKKAAIGVEKIEDALLKPSMDSLIDFMKKLNEWKKLLSLRYYRFSIVQPEDKRIDMSTKEQLESQEGEKYLKGAKFLIEKFGKKIFEEIDKENLLEENKTEAEQQNIALEELIIAKAVKRYMQYEVAETKKDYVLIENDISEIQSEIDKLDMTLHPGDYHDGRKLVKREMKKVFRG